MVWANMKAYIHRLLSRIETDHHLSLLRCGFTKSQARALCRESVLVPLLFIPVRAGAAPWFQEPCQRWRWTTVAAGIFRLCRER